MTRDSIKPLPEVTADNRRFWEGCKRHQLLLQKCRHCGLLRHANPLCPRCWTREHDWVAASGKGKVYSWIVVHQRYHRAFEPELPYNVAIVELEEGPRLVTNVVEIANDDLSPDLAVEVVWDEVTAEITLPKFRPHLDFRQRTG